ncbi:MAG TPA: hypothetical protein VFL62_10295 [Bradyrhizobium sp.]|uniref:hypothetical protein n=1 Tax=Bradyrhizobium sp. TaxID=376 RepID=UPI002D80715B|nr:hypothetical protein [Bradyrhizobium sp.]HET7886605.1 hypothetical protein [Bradyrhizobium sp.]
MVSVRYERYLAVQSVRSVVAISGPNGAYDCDRYRKLLAEANDEPKRLALIKLLIDEKAKDRLAQHRLQTRISGLDGSKASLR